MNSRRGLIVIATILVIAAPATLPASDGADTPTVSQPNWGLADNIVQGISAFGFLPWNSTLEWTTDPWLYVSFTNSSGWLFSPLVLPAGARIVALELEACDSNATGGVVATLMVCPHRGRHTCVASDLIDTGDAETPGCGGFFGLVDPPVVVDNLTNTHLLYVGLDVATVDLGFLSVLVSYQLQISPAPAVATFPDVAPGFWAFQEIEALAASGITTGFPDGTFRPTAPVTRAQMATFLARALGLHWPY